MRKDSPLSCKKTIKPQDLWNLSLIIERQKHVDNNIAAWIKKGQKKLNIVATYNLLFNARLMVEKKYRLYFGIRSVN